MNTGQQDDPLVRAAAQFRVSIEGHLAAACREMTNAQEAGFTVDCEIKRRDSGFFLYTLSIIKYF